jgi:Ion channel
MTTTKWSRGTFTQFINRHNAAWETTMAVLAAGYVYLAIHNDDAPGSVPTKVLLGCTLVFLAEFAARYWDAPSRWQYFRQHWLDLVSCIPLVGGLRAIRLLRLVRLGVGLRAISAIERLAQGKEGGRQSLWFLGPTLLVLWVGSAYSIWALEHGVNPNIRTFTDALYWAIVTVTTVGYGDIAPVTSAGRIVSGLLIILGIGLVGFVSSRLTALWLEQEGSVVERELQAIRADLAEIRALLVSRGSGELPALMQNAPPSIPAEVATTVQELSLSSVSSHE